MNKTKKHRTGNIFLRGKTFWLKYMIEGRLIRQSLETSDIKEAEEKRDEIMRPIMAGRRADALAIVKDKLSDAQIEVQTTAEAANPPLTLADTWKAYEAATNRPDSSDAMLYRNESIWKRFSSWLQETHPDKLFLRDVDNTTAAAYSKKLTADKLTTSTFNQHIGFLRLVWRCLADEIRGNGNPWMQVSKKGQKQKLAHRHKAVTPEQFDNLLKAAPDADLHDLLFVLGWTGQRLIDGVMLRWDTVDFKRRVITLHPVKTARTGKAVHIPLLPPLTDLLQKRRDMVAGDFVFPDFVEYYERDRTAVSKRIQKTFIKAGLNPTTTLPGVQKAVAVYGAHSLRHFFATQALSAGIPGEIVKRITGHTSDAMLEGYEHIDAALIGGLAEKLSNGNGKPLAQLQAPADDIRAQVRKLANMLNGRNWKTVKKKLQNLAN